MISPNRGFGFVYTVGDCAFGLNEACGLLLVLLNVVSEEKDDDVWKEVVGELLTGDLAGGGLLFCSLAISPFPLFAGDFGVLLFDPATGLL